MTSSALTHFNVGVKYMHWIFIFWSKDNVEFFFQRDLVSQFNSIVVLTLFHNKASLFYVFFFFIAISLIDFTNLFVRKQSPRGILWKRLNCTKFTGKRLQRDPFFAKLLAYSLGQNIRKIFHIWAQFILTRLLSPERKLPNDKWEILEI